MVLNVSGRTDVVAFYMDWLVNRIREGYFIVRNPFYPKLLHRIDWEDVDMVVFCTKNPRNLLNNIEKIDKPFVVHVTLTPYLEDIEVNVPNKSDVMEDIKRLAKIIGPNRVMVRYDPIIKNSKYTIDYHIDFFKRLTEELDGYTKTIIVSFVDLYKNVLNNISSLKLEEFTESDYERIGINFSKYASMHGMSVQTCCEERTLFEYGFIKEDCVSEGLVEAVSGKVIKKKWNARGKSCGCVAMHDVGDYNSCKHLCKYCYANYDEKKVFENTLKHDKNSPILIGNIKGDEEIIKIKQ